LGLDLKQSQQARSSLKTTLAEAVNRESRNKTKGLNQETSQFVNLLYEEGDRSAAREVLDNSVWLAKHAPQSLARMYSELEKVAPKSDYGQLSQLKFFVNTVPEKVSNDDIWFGPQFGKVTSADKQAAQIRRDTLLKQGKQHPETFQGYKRMQSEIKKLDFPGRNDAERISNRVIAGDTMEQWYENNPNAKPEDLEKIFAEVIKPAKVSKLAHLLDLIWFGRPGTEKALKKREGEIEALRKAGIESGKKVDEFGFYVGQIKTDSNGIEREYIGDNKWRKKP
jgi:hypothetical protein